MRGGDDDDFDDGGRDDNNDRVRQFSHVEGNYATSVKIRWRLTRREKRMVDDVVRELQLFFSSSNSTVMRRVRVRELLKSSSETDEDDDKMMHVSLSCTCRSRERFPSERNSETRTERG